MSKIFACFALLIITFKLHAQKTEWLPTRPYEPMNYDSLSPIWYHTFYDSKGIGSDTCDGYNFIEFIYHIEPIIEDNYIYVAVGTRNTRDLNTGALIEKRRLSDGELVWQSSLTYPEVGRQEVPRFMNIVNKEYLEVYYLKRNKPFDVSDPYYLLKSGVSYDMSLSKRTFELESGEILTYLDSSDTVSTNIKYSYKTGESLGSSNLYSFGKNMLYVAQNIQIGKPFYVSHFMEEDCDFIRSDTFWISGIQRGNNVAKISDDSLIIIEEVFNKPALLHLFNNQFELIKTVELENIDFPKEIKLIEANSTGILIECLIKKDLLYHTYQLVIIDFNGKVRKKVNFINENTYIRIYDVLNWGINGEILLMAKKYVIDTLTNPLPNQNYEVSQAVDFWYADAQSDLHLIKRYKSKDNRRYVLPYVQKSVKLDNGDYIVFLLESAIDTISLKSAGFENDFDARASSIMRITPQQAGLSVTNIDETTPSGLLFKVFPNPVKDKLHIVANNSNIDLIIIKDVFGRLCYHEFISGKFDLEDQMEISMKDMTAGIYFITLSTGSRTQTLKLIVE